MDEEKDAAEDAADPEEEKDVEKDEGITMKKRTGNSHGTTMATAIELKMIHMTFGTGVEAKAGKEEEKALEARAKERPSKEKVKEKEKDSRKEKDNLILPILLMPHLLQNHNQVLLTLPLRLTKVSAKDRDHIAADANPGSMMTRTALL